MKELTTGPINRHLIILAVPIAIGMFVQMLYFLVDLYFVSQIGPEAVAGVTAAANVMLIVFGLTQMISIATVALVSNATGAKDRQKANLIFNQSAVMAILGSVLTLTLGYAGAQTYLHTLAANEAVMAAGLSYLHWYLPGLSLQFPLAVMGATLRGTGVTKPTMVVQMLTVLLNIVLAPILITGWGIGHPLGAAGAGLASTISIAFGMLLMLYYFVKLESYVSIMPSLQWPRLKIWRDLIRIGFPAGGETLMMFLFTTFAYVVIRDFGAAAQAGFGIGARLLQMVFLPAMAIGFAVPAVAGQNVGARLPARVRQTLWSALKIEVVVMTLLALFCHIAPTVPVSGFSSDPEVINVAATFIRISSWNFIASGIVFACSGMFQALGNTWPGFAASATRLITFLLPLAILLRQPSFELVEVWYVSVASVAVQAIVVLVLVRWQLNVKLDTPLKGSAESRLETSEA